MENWSASSKDFGFTQPPVHTSRVLSSISGNAQSFPSDSKHHLDHNRSYLHTTRAVSEPKYLAPCVTLGSNDRLTFHDHLLFQKARRSSQPHKKVLRERPYLQNEKYIEYRRRKRQDLGKDGKPIWPDHIEASFQNGKLACHESRKSLTYPALVHIPPLGRKKRTQRGKLLGRNELIREWILQETGEDRDRKQISSHIQVLGNVFKDVPEWKMVTAGCRDDDDDEQFNSCKDYYGTSIADQVRIQRELAELARSEFDDDASGILGFHDERVAIRKMTFDMWVSVSENDWKPLHKYTCITERNRPSATVELEGCENWESLFPDLGELLDGDQFEILLLKSRFNLMSDYPPADSKLVLGLDLDFREPGIDSSWMKYFTSINHLYHNGKRLRRSEHKNCLAVEPGVVKPFFEAEWWAVQFTEVTRRMKEAADMVDATKVNSADEYSRSLFRGLTIMQEIFVSPRHSETGTPGRRVGVLLWIFAQISNGNPGITTWQHVTAQSGWSQVPLASNVCLPSLNSECVVDDQFHMDESALGLDPTIPISPIPYEPGTYHSGFTPYHGIQDAQAFDFSAVTSFTPRASSFVGVKPNPNSLMVSLNLIPPFLPSQNLPDEKPSLSELSDAIYEGTSGPGPTTYDLQPPPSIGPFMKRDTLANFDMSTHEMLQAQLGSFDESLPRESADMLEDVDISVDMHDLDTDSQQSMLGHMHDLELDEVLSQAMLTDDCPATPTLDHHKLMLEHPTIFESPKVVRPPLLSHNSFAGILHTTELDDEPLHFDTPTRNEFARVVSGQMDARNEDLLGADVAMDGFAVVGEFEPGRPRSQPILPSNDHGLNRSDPICLDMSE